MVGLEPTTFCMASRRSSQLSYIRVDASIAASAPRSTRKERELTADSLTMAPILENLLDRLGSLEDLHLLAGSFPGALMILDPDLRVVLAGGERFADRPQDELEGLTLAEIFGPSVASEIEPHYREALGGSRTTYDGTFEAAAYRTEIAPLRSNGRVVGVIAIATDATERADADRRLRELNMELETILTHAPIGLALVDLEGGWIRVNDRICEIVGYTREELLTKSFQDITHPDDLEADVDHARALAAGEIASYGMEKRYFHKDGHVVWVWLSVGLIRDDRGAARHYVSQIEDITARKRGEHYLEAERAVATALAEMPTVAEAWSRVLEAIGTTMEWEHGEAWLVDEDAQVLVCAGTWSANPDVQPFAETKGFVFKKGEGLPGHVWQQSRPGWVADALSEPSFVRAAQARAVGLKSGVGLPLISRGGTIGTICFFSRRLRQRDPELLDLMSRLGRQIGEFFARRRDEAERQALELQLLEAQKRESLGVLAGGIAHDFNNLLVGVLGNASLLREELPAGSPLRELAEQIELAATRAAGLTRQMLDYSGKGSFVVAAIDVSRAVAETVQLLRPALPRHARVELDLEPDLPPVRADPSQFGQLVMNLVTNAAEAIDKGGGILVRTAALDADRTLLDGFRFGTELEPGSYVLIEIADEGRGMDTGIVERMFEPYFTTMFSGRGLGLAASLWFVHGHGGALRVASAPGAGTTMSVLLPASAHERAPLVSAAAAPAGAGTVLVVDDEQIVLDVAEKGLAVGGYTVLTANSGDTALECFALHRDEIVCVLLDLTMPGRSGDDVLRALRAIDPHIRVVLSSGYSPDAVDPSAAVEFLQKPYTLAELLQIVGAS